MNKPLYATDVILFSMIGGELKVLLIKRAKGERFSEMWALPGGLVNYKEKETSAIKAKKILKQRLGITDDVYLERNAIYDDIDRDPDEYSISVTYLSLIDENKTKMMNGDGVSEIKWFSLKDIPTLAFDHNKMVEDAVAKIRRKLKRSSIGFKFLPKEFTIPQLRQIYENLIGIEINPSNFRTKLLKMNILTSCNKKQRLEDDKPLKGQPPQLYLLKEDALNNIIDTEQLFRN